MHYESSRTVKTLNAIGTMIDWSTKSYHVAEGITRRVMKPMKAKKLYQYCPSTEGLLPCWLEQEDHLIRWFRVCFDIYCHPDGKSYSRFPVELIHEEFPEFVDIDTDTYYQGYWATYESIKAYGLDKSESWDRNIPTLLHQLGAMQQFIPYHQAVNPRKYQAGDRFVWETGIQNNTYAKDLFELDSTEPMPKCPALRLRQDLDGTSSPSYEGMEDMKPAVSCFLRFSWFKPK